MSESKTSRADDHKDRQRRPARSKVSADAVIRHLPIGVVVFDRQLKIIESNEAARELLQVAERIDESLQAGTASEQAGAWTEQLQGVLQARQAKSFDNVNYSYPNRLPRLLHLSCTPLEDAHNRRIGGILVIEDVTERAAIEKELAMAERLAAMGRMAARVAHELNNPLDGILRFINLAIRVIATSGQQQPVRYLEQARQGLMRMVQIISELLEYSRSTYAAFEEADVNKIVEEAVSNMEAKALAANVKIVRNLNYDMPNIRSGNLVQVFCNLIKNAIDAMSDGGTLTITTDKTEREAIISFADTGPGLKPEEKDRIFEPFFTTKPPGKGTGLGLAICKDILQRYNSTIEAENRPEGGCVFTVRIPLESCSTVGKDKTSSTADGGRDSS